MTATVEVASTDVTDREISLGTAGNLDAVGILAQEDTPIHFGDSERLIHQRLGIATLVIESLQLLLAQGDERCTLFGEELHLLAQCISLKTNAFGTEGVHGLVV